MTKVMDLYTALLDHFGPQNWWPADTPFEVCVGAILTQQTKWDNVERAIQNIKDNRMMDTVRIAQAEPEDIESLVHPTGFYKQKTGYLQAFCQHLVSEYDGDLDALLDKDIHSLRKELLALRGIGPETADSIILYAAGEPTFVVDAYTVRVGRRIGLFKTNKYELVKEYTGKKQYTARELSKTMLEKYGDDTDRTSVKEALRKLIDSGRCVYTYRGSSYVELAEKEGC